ncbi:MAG: tetratricopeptide repeat protein [Gemmatimonadetes bacterium]|nr:tetratricopeptide repeat protein [Gemmatimonadota bacterium]
MPAVHTLKCWFLIVLAGALCYLNALGNGFVFDDSAYLSSPLVHQFRPLAAFLQSSIHPDLYRPLTLLSLAGDFHCYGDQPLGYHLSSLLLHLLNSLLVFQLSYHILARQSAALLAALFYALHPLQTEVVSWISSRGDLLMSLFFLAGLLCHIRTRTRRGRVLAWFLYGCSILSKESGFVLPAVAYCYDALLATPAHPFRHLFTFTRAWLVRHWGYVLVLTLALALRWNAAEAAEPVSANFLADADAISRLLTLPAILLRYLLLIVFPLHLSADYSYASIPLVRTPLDPYFIAGLLAAGALLYLPLRTSSPPLVFAAAFGWLAFLPASNLLVLAPSGMAERYLHPVMPALALLFGLATKTWFTKRYRIAGFAIVAIVLLLMAVRTIDRNRDWASDYALFSAVVALYPDNARARENLAHAHYQQGDVKGAVEHYKRAIAINPHRVRPYYNLGLLHNAEGQYRPAIRIFKAALELNPNHAGVHYNTGLAYQKMSRHAPAIPHYKKTLRQSPEHARAAFNLGRAYQHLGQYSQAIESYQTALTLDPSRTSAYYHLGELYRTTGDFCRMTTAWQTLLRLVPHHSEAERLRSLLQPCEKNP